MNTICENRLVLLRAFGNEPLMREAFRVGERGQPIFRTGLGWPLGHFFAPDDALYARLRAAFDIGNTSRVDQLWREAKPWCMGAQAKGLR